MSWQSYVDDQVELNTMLFLLHFSWVISNESIFSYLQPKWCQPRQLLVTMATSGQRVLGSTALRRRSRRFWAAGTMPAPWAWAGSLLTAWSRTSNFTLMICMTSKILDYFSHALHHSAQRTILLFKLWFKSKKRIFMKCAGTCTCLATIKWCEARRRALVCTSSRPPRWRRRNNQTQIIKPIFRPSSLLPIVSLLSQSR